MLNSSASMTFGAAQGGGTGSNSRYIRDHNLQFIFNAVSAMIEPKMASGRVSRSEEEKLVNEALGKVQDQLKANADRLQFGRTLTIKESSTGNAVIALNRKDINGSDWTADVAYKSTNGNLNCTIDVNGAQIEELQAVLQRFAPYIVEVGAQSLLGTKGTVQGPSLTMVVDGRNYRLETSDGACYRHIDDLVSILREIRQSLHTRRMFVPL